MYEKMCDRIRELVKAITEGPDAVRREFYMSVPARPDRDADIVLSAAADAIAALESESAQYREAAEKAEKECERLRDMTRLALEQLEIVENGEQLTACGANAIAALRCGLAMDSDSIALLRAALAAGEG